MQELWDVLDCLGRRTGRTVEAGSYLKDDEYHGAVTAWICDGQGRFLIARRALEADSAPGIWEAVSGGVTAGEDSLSAAVREAKEEIGIALDRENARHFCSYTWPMGNGRGNVYYDVYLFTARFGREEVRLQKGETMDAKWASPGEMREMIGRGELVAYTYLEELLRFAQ